MTKKLQHYSALAEQALSVKRHDKTSRNDTIKARKKRTKATRINPDDTDPPIKRQNDCGKNGRTKEIYCLK